MKDDFFREIEVDEVIDPISPFKIDLVEKKYNLKLPSSYIDFLKKQNGGYINYAIFPTLRDTIKIESISGIQGNKKFKDVDILEESAYYIKEWNLPKKLLFLSGDGHWWIGLDYRKLNKDSEPTISFIDTEEKIDTIISNDFQEFINNLQKE
jgi:hypothetical protein